MTDMPKSSGAKRISFTSALKRHSTKFKEDFVNHDHIFYGPSFDGGASGAANIAHDIKNPITDLQSSKKSITE